MLHTTKYKIDGLHDELCDVDLTPSGGWIGVTGLDQNQRLLFNGVAVPLPQPIRWPHIAAISDELVFVVNRRTEVDEKNGWLITASGEVRSHFYVGDAIQDILASDQFLVATYFDESACISRGIEGNGVAVFDAEGNYTYGYKEVFGAYSVDVADCYCVCWSGRHQIYFHPYTAFPVVRWNLLKNTQEIFETPSEIVGSGAMTNLGPKLYFHGPYDDQAGIYEWQAGDETANRIGEHEGRVRGALLGRFVSVDEDGSSIIHASELSSHKVNR